MGLWWTISSFVRNLEKCGCWCHHDCDLCAAHIGQDDPVPSTFYLSGLFPRGLFCSYLTFHQVFAYKHILLTSFQNPSPYLHKPEWLLRDLWLGIFKYLQDNSQTRTNSFRLCTVLTLPPPPFCVPGLMHKNVNCKLAPDLVMEINLAGKNILYS